MPQNQKGVALILALLVLTILIVIIGEMSFTSMQNSVIAKNYVDDLQNSYTARSGYNYGALFLQYDTDMYTDHLGELWAQPHTLKLDQAKSHADVFIEDDHSKINLDEFTTAQQTAGYKVALSQLERLVVNAGYNKSYADGIADYINGKGDVLYNIEELLRIPNFPYSLLYGVNLPQNQDSTSTPTPTFNNGSTTGIRKFLTNVVTKDTWLININTAPREVLTALDDELTPQVADAIIAYRQQLASKEQPEGFKNPSDLLNVDGVTSSIYGRLNGYLTVSSSYFTIKVRAVTGALEKGWLYAVNRNGSTITLIQASRSNDFLFIQPPQADENSPK